MIKKYENYNNKDIIWNVENINKLIQYEEDQMEIDIKEQENSSFPEGEQESITRHEGRIELLREMMDKKSWFYKKFN